MDLVTHSLLVLSAVAIALALLSFRFWTTQKNHTEFLLFSLFCISSAVYSWFEMVILVSDSTAEMGEYIWWSQVPAGIAFISVAAFLYIYLKAGHPWLFWAAVGLRASGMFANLFLSPNILFSKIIAIRYVTSLGERLSIPIGSGNPWSLINHASIVCFLVFCIDASITTWRRGDRQKAIVFGGSTIVSLVFSLAVLTSTVWSSDGFPVLASPAFIFVILAMGYELNSELYNTAILAKTLEAKESELRESIKQLQLSAGAADVGVWLRSFDGHLMWASDKWYELYELEPETDLPLNKLMERLDPDGRRRVETAFRSSQEVDDEFEIEYRLQLRDGGIRWIRASGRVDLASDGSLLRRGAAVDITKLKLAQESAHELSRKLMNAQEKERARLARELHDDLSQSLALLSIQLHSIASENGGKERFSSQLGNITYQIDRLSSDVHRISHQLHPAKLEQLGLVSALRGFCREIGTAHEIKIDFHDENIPSMLPNDVSLCLYRVAQESLHNVVKHSGASNVTVDLAYADGEVRLSIADNGSGFDVTEQEKREGIGLISMKERLRVVDGGVTIDSTVGAGTKVVVTVPIGRQAKVMPGMTSLVTELFSFTA